MVQIGKKGRKKPKTREEASTRSSMTLYDETNSPTDGDLVAKLWLDEWKIWQGRGAFFFMK